MVKKGKQPTLSPQQQRESETTHRSSSIWISSRWWTEFGLGDSPVSSSHPARMGACSGTVMTTAMPAREKIPEVWAVYVRVSSRQQVEEGFSLDHQKETLISYADDHEWAWELFEDAGISGEALDNRPGMVSMLEAADRGQFMGVLVVDESRLARDEFIAALIRQRLKSAGVKVATPSRGEYDLADPSDNFAANVLAAAHAFEQDIRTAKSRTGRRRAAEAGYWTGGPPPYGYRLEPSSDGHHKVLVIDEAQASVLRLVYDLIVIQGQSAYSATTYLNARGYRTSRGRPWRHPNLCFRLRQRAIAGTWTYHHAGDPVEVTIPAILTEGEWDRLQGAIKGSRRPQRKHRTYPLTGRQRGHLRCVCGGHYFGKTDSSKKGRSYYECSQNHHTFGDDRCHLRPRITQAPTLDQAVWDAVSAVLTDGDYLAALAADFLGVDGNEERRPDTTMLERQLGRLRTEETNIVRALARNGDLREEILQPALEEVSSERRTIEKELARLAAVHERRLDRITVEMQLRRLAAIAKERMADPTLEMMTEVFDLLELDLIRVEGGLYEGVGRLPLLTGGVGAGEVWTKEPRLLSPPRPRSDRVS